MTKNFYFFLASLLLTVTIATGAQAQSRSREELRVDVPFDFNVGNTSLAAGEYRVSIVNPASDRSVVQIIGVDGQSKALVLTNDIESAYKANARLTFRHYGNQYFLAQVWMAAEPAGLAITHSKIEKQLQRQLDNGAKDYSMVAVSAR
jgi:hypothetical protein